MPQFRLYLFKFYSVHSVQFYNKK